MKKALHRNGLVAQFAYAVQIVVMLFYPALALAGPDDPTVVGGDASVTQPDANTTLIQQGSDSAIINWRGFSIDVNELVKFEGGKATLNRVTGGDPSSIMGQLIADHRIFIVNQNGVVFGPDSHVDVAGLVATTFNIENDAFMNGDLSFAQDPSAQLAAIVNKGEIRVSDNGFVFLVAPAVSNEGLIIANLGQVVLGAGSSMTLDFNGDGLVTYQVDGKVLDRVVSPDGTTMRDAVANKGTIQANGGAVLLHADAVDSVFDSLVNNSGVIQAQSLENRGGSVVLEGNSSAEFKGLGAANNLGQVEATDGVVLNTGEIDVAAIEVGAQGGTVVLSGAYVGVSGDINAQGGGNVLVASSMNTVLTSSATIDVSGQGSGDAGSVVVWSDQTTRFFGTILGRGGETGGDGADIEVSGYNGMIYRGSVDLTAANGAWGSVLLDPAIIDMRGDDTATDSADDNDALTNEFAGNPSGVNGTVIDTDLPAGTLLLFESELEGTAAGTINLTATTSIIDSFTDGDATLNLGARNIVLTTTGAAAGVVTLNDLAISTTGSITIQGSSGGVNTTDITVAESLTAGAGGITVDTNNGSVTFGDGVTVMTVTSAGGLTVNATGAIDDTANVNFAITGNATFDNNGGGVITMGNDAGTTMNFGSLTFDGGASVIFLEDSDMVLAGASVATDEVNLTSNTGSIDDGAGATLTLGTDQVGDSEVFFGATTTITLDNAGHSFDTVRVNGTTVTLNESTSATAFTGASTATTLNVTAAGAITDVAGASLVVTGVTTLNAGANAITLNEAGNNFGTVTFTGSTGDATLVDANAIILGGTSGATLNSLTVTALGGDITDTGTLLVNNTTTLNSGGNDVILDVAANNFATVTFTGTTGDATLVDTNNIDLGGTTGLFLNSLTVTASAGITDSGTLLVNNTTLLNGGAFGAQLNTATNDFATVTFTGTTGASQIVDVDDLILGGTNGSILAALNVATGGALTDSGIILAATTTLNSTAAFSITLDNANNFSGDVQVVAALNVTLNDVDALTFGLASTISGNLIVTANGAITDGAAGTLAVTGTTNLTAGAANNVTLNNGNDFIGDVTVQNGFDVNFNDINNIQFAGIGTLAAVNSLIVTATTLPGTITDAAGATIDVTNNANFSGGSIVLGDNGGDTTRFGTLTFNSSVGVTTITEDNAQTVTGVNNAATAATLTSNGAWDLAAASSLTAGSLVVNTTAAGTITDGAGSTFAIAGNASFTAVGFAITLGDSAAPADTTNFNNLTFSGSVVAITEDSQMDLTNGSIGTTSVVLTTTGGAFDIVDFVADGNGVAGSENVTSPQIFFNAAGSVGLVANAIEIDATEMQAVAAAVGGNVFVRDTATGLDLDDWSVVGNSVQGGGAATITALSPLTVSANVVMGGAVLLQSDDSTNDGAVPGFPLTDDITVNTGITVQSTGSSVSLQAGDNIDLVGTAALTAATFVSLTADAVIINNSDALGGIRQGAGSVITAPSLAIRSADSVTLDGNNDVTNLSANVTTAAATLTFYDATGLGDAVNANLNISTVDGLAGVTTNAGVITLRMDNLSFGGGAGEDIDSGAARTNLEPFTVTQNIDLGLVAETAAALALSDAELDLITAGVIQVGRTDFSNTGTILVSAPISPLNTTTLTLITSNTTASAISQTLAANGITETNLRIRSVGGVDLTAANNVGTLAADVTQAGSSFRFGNVGSLIVGTVDGATGIETNGADINLISGGTLTVQNSDGADDVTTDISDTGTNANIVYRADDLDLQAGSTTRASAFGTTGFFIWLVPFSNDRDIDIGLGASAGQLNISAAEIGTLTSNILRIGYRDGLGDAVFNGPAVLFSGLRVSSDDITVTAPIVSPGQPVLSLLTGSAANAGTITQTAASTITWNQLRTESVGNTTLTQNNVVNFLVGHVYGAGNTFDFVNNIALDVAAGPTALVGVPPVFDGIDIGLLTAHPLGAGAGIDNVNNNSGILTNDGNVAITVNIGNLNVRNSILSCDIQSGAGSTSLTGGVGGNVIVAPGAQVCGTGVTVGSFDNVVLNNPIHSTTFITIRAGLDGTGSIIDPVPGDDLLDLDAPVISLFAADDIGTTASPIEISAGILVAQAGLTVGGVGDGAGEIALRVNSNFVDAFGVGAFGDGFTPGVTLSRVSANGNISINGNPLDDAPIVADNGDINVQAPTSPTEVTTLTAGFYDAPGLTRDFGVQALGAGNDVTIRALGTGTVRLGTGGALNAADLVGTVASHLAITDVEAADQITLVGLNVVDSDLVIIDLATGGSGNRANVMSASLLMVATTGIGTINNHLEGITNFLHMVFGIGGGFYDNFSGGLLTATDLDLLRTFTATAIAGGLGGSYVENHSPITIGMSWVTGGSQTWIADEAFDPAVPGSDDLTVVDGFRVVSTAGSIILTSGDSVIVGDGTSAGVTDAVVAAFNQVTLNAGVLGVEAASDSDTIGDVTIRGVVGFDVVSGTTATRVNVNTNNGITMLLTGVNIADITTTAGGRTVLDADKNGLAGGAIVLGNVTTGRLDATSVGTITQVAGSSVFAALVSNLDASGSSITLANATNDFGGAVNVTNADDVSIADANAFVLGSIVAADDVTLTVVGAITDGNNGATNVTGDLLTVTGGTGFGTLANGVETVVNTVTATGIGAGGFFMKNTGDLSILGIALVAAGDVNVEAASDLSIDATIDAAGGNVTLTASESILSTVAAATLDIDNALTVTLTAGGGAGNIGAGAAAGIIEVEATTMVLRASGAGNVVVSETTDGGTVTATSGSGNITLVSAGALDFAGASTTGTLTATVAGAITDTGALVIGGTTTLDAGANAITLDTATNDFTTVTTAAGQTGTVTLVDRNAIDLGGTSGATLASLTVTASGNITQSGILLATTATFAAGAGGNVTLNNAANDFDTATVLSGATVNLVDGDDLIVGASASSGNFTVTAGTALTLGVLTVGGAGVGDGNIIATATAGDLTFDSLTAAGDRVTLTSTAGSVNENGDAGVDVTAGGFVAVSALGVGTTETIESNVRFFEATGGAGGIDLANVGALTVGGIGAVTSVTATGAITISAASPLTVSMNVTSAGAIALAAGETGALGDNLTLNLGVVVQSTASTVTLTAGDDVVFGGVINAATDTIVAAGSADAGDGGSVVNANGTLTDITAVSLTVSAVGVTAANGIDVDTAITTLTTAGVAGVGGIDVSDIGGGLAALLVTTADGAISISGTGGAMVATTVTAGGTGGVTLNNVGGATTLTLGTTVNGDIVVNGNGGLVTLTTAIAGGTGSIEASSLAGGLTITTAITTNGDIVANGNGGAVSLAVGGGVLAAGGTGSIEASSTGGTLTIETAITTDGDIVANGNGGAVTLTTLIAGTNGDISVSSIGGALTLTTGVTTNGDITANADGGTLTLTTLTAGGSGDIVGVGTADISIDSLTAALTVSLAAGTTIDETGDAGTDITAVSASLSSGTGIGTAGSIEVDLTTLTSALVTGAGLIDLNDVAGGLNVLSAVTLGLGTITLAAAGGDLGLGTVNASGGAAGVTLTSTTGAITDLNGGDTNVIGTTLTATAATGIDTDTAITTLTLALVTGVGAIDIANDGDLAITAATTTDGSIEISALSIDVTGAVTAAGAGNDVFLTAAGTDSDITLTGTVTAPDLVNLNAGGSILDNGDAGANDVTATNLILIAGEGVGTGGDAIETTVANLAGSGGTGGFALTDLAGGLFITTVGTVSGVTASAGDITIGTLSPLTVLAAVATADNVTLTAGTVADADDCLDDLTIGEDVNQNGVLDAGEDLDADGVLDNAPVSGHNVTLNAADDVEINDNVSAVEILDINAGDGIAINDFIFAGEFVSMTAGDAGAGADDPTACPNDLVFGPGGGIFADDIVIVVPGDITLGTLKAVNTITVTSTGGSIFLGLDGVVDGILIAGTAVTLAAANDIEFRQGGTPTGPFPAENTAIRFGTLLTMTAGTDGTGSIADTNVESEFDVTGRDVTAAAGTGAGITFDGQIDTLNFAIATTGAINISDDGDNLSVGVVATDAASTVTLTATGAITDLNGPGTNNVTGLNLIATTGAGVNLDTVITGGGTLTATVSGDGDIDIRNASGGALTVTAATVAGSGDVTVTNNSDMTVTLGTAANGDVTFVTTAGDIASTTATSGQGNVNLTAADDLFSTTATSANGNVTLTAVTTLTSTTATSGNGNVELTAGTTLTSTTATSANGNVGLTAGTALASTTASATDGNVDLTAGTTLVSGAATATDGNANLTAGTTLTSTTVTTTNGNANLTAGTTLASTTVTTTNGDAVLTAGAALTATTTTTTNGDAIFSGTTATLTTVTAGGAGAGDGSVIATATAGDILIDSITADGDSVSLTAAGAINEIANDAAADVVADSTLLSGGAGVGTANTPLEVNVATLAGRFATGGFFVTDTAGGLTVGTVAGVTGVQDTALASIDAVTIIALSPLTISGSVITSGTVTLTATESADAGNFADDLTIDLAVVVQSTTADVNLNAGDDISIAGNVNAATAAVLTAGAGDLDAGGSVADASGSLVNVQAATLTVTAVGNNNAGLAIDLDTTVTTVTAATVGTTVAGAQTGGIDLTDSAGGLTVTTATTEIGDITIEAIDTTGIGMTVTTATAGTSGADADSDITLTTTDTGNLTIGILTAAGDRVTLDSTGNVNDTDAGTAVTATELVAVTDEGFGTADTINTVVDDVEGTGGLGVFNMTDSGDLTIGITTNSAQTGITADGAITVTTIDAGAGDTSIDVLENVQGDAAVTLTATERAAANANADDISVDPFVTVEAGTTLTMSAGDDLDLAGLLIAGGSALLTSGAGAGDTDAGGSIHDLNGVLENVIATDMTATAVGGATVDGSGLGISLDTRITTLTAATVGGGLAGIQTGGIRVEDTQFGMTVLSSTTELGTITLSATGGDLAIAGTGVTAGTGAAIAGNGNIVLNTFTGTGAGGPTTSGDITLGVAGATTLIALGDLVELNSVSSVLDAQADGNPDGTPGTGTLTVAETNVTARLLLVNAQDGFGTAAERVETRLTEDLDLDGVLDAGEDTNGNGILDGTAAGTFDQVGWHHTNAGALIVGSVAGVDGVTVAGIRETDVLNDGAATADITIQALSPLFIVNDLLAAGDILLIADETADPGVGADDVRIGEDINGNGILDAGEDVNGNGALDTFVIVKSTLGSIEVQAGDDIFLALGSTLEAFGSVTLRAGFDADEGDLDGIGSATILGSINPGVPPGGGGPGSVGTGPVIITALGDIILGLVVAPNGLIIFTEFGNILDGNGPALNIQANGLITLTAVRGVIGLDTDAIEIEVQAGQVVANAGGSADRVSINLNGDIEPDGRFFSSVTAPGLELFNNTVLGGDGVDDVTDRFYKYTCDRQIMYSGERDHGQPGSVTFLMLYIGDEIVNPEALYQWDASLEGPIGGGK